MLLHQSLDSAQVSEACHSTPHLSLIRQARVSMGTPPSLRGGTQPPVKGAEDTHLLVRGSMVSYHRQGRASMGSPIRQGRASMGSPIRQARASMGSPIKQGRHLEGLTLTLTCPATVSRLMAIHPTAPTLPAMVQIPTAPTLTLVATEVTAIPRTRVRTSSSSPTKHSRVMTAVTLRILTWAMVITWATTKRVRPC